MRTRRVLPALAVLAVMGAAAASAASLSVGPNDTVLSGAAALDVCDADGIDVVYDFASNATDVMTPPALTDLEVNGINAACDGHVLRVEVEYWDAANAFVGIEEHEITIDEAVTPGVENFGTVFQDNINAETIGDVRVTIFDGTAGGADTTTFTADAA